MKRLITKKDFILLCVVLVVGVLGIIILNTSSHKGATAEIKVDGETVEIIPLDGEYLEIEFNGVAVCRENSEIYVKNSSCPDKVCVRSGKISKAGEGIICAPNRVAVTISGKSDTLPDALTG